MTRTPATRTPGTSIAPTGTVTIRLGGSSLRTTRRRIVGAIVLIAVILVLAMWATTLGSYDLAPTDVVAAVLGTADRPTTTVVLQWRAPRIVAAVLFGASLAIGGAVFQSLTRNPLGSPDVIGFSVGSYTGVVATLLLGLSGTLVLAAGALAGGLLTAAAVYALAYRRGVRSFRLIIMGIAVAAFLTAVNTWFSTKVDVDVALRAAVWGAGTLSIVDWASVGLSAVVLCAVIVAGPAAARRLQTLELGDDGAAALGVRVERTKVWLIVLGITATALVTAAAGPIAFIALAAPQIARRITGSGTSIDLLGSALVGALLLLAADVIAQHAIPGVVLPTGAVTVCLGGAYLVWLLAAESRSGLRSGRP
ncbi:iron chelate uptake ABC transporter family permease subunit [Plantibacter flavus]|uniref:FecCD family ABC transporter permease n=1 Tax=Plantibacter flavus TaxID=150123 RepID=UPI003F1585EC